MKKHTKVKVKITSKLLEPGKSITRKQFIKLAAKLDPAIATMSQDNPQFNLRLVSAQARLNKTLTDSGIYIKSQNYYNTFNVLNKPVKQVGRYYAESAAKRARGSRLADGITNPKPTTHYF